MLEQQDEIKEKQTRNLVFHGTGGGYFSVCIVNLFLIIVTFGIFAPWAFIRSKRYLYGNTELSGSRFAYHATGGSIFLSWVCLFIFIFALEAAVLSKNSLMAFVLLAILVLFFPYLLVQSIRYQMQSTTLNNVRFNFRCSGFKAWWSLLGCPLLMTLGVLLVCGLIMATCSSVSIMDLDQIIITGVITLVVGVLGIGGIQGVATALRLRLFFDHSSFGTQTFTSQISIKKCVTLCLIGMLILVPFLLALFTLIGPAYVQITFASMKGEPEVLAASMESLQSTILFGELIYIAGLLLSFSFVYVSLRNYYYNAVKLSEKIAFRSTLTLRGFLLQMVVNTLLVMCTFGIGYPWARVRYCRYLAQNTWVDGDLDELDLQDHDEKIATDIVSCLSRGLVPNINF